MSLFPLRCLPKLRPVAAADYFLRNRFMSWFACHIIGIIPIARKRQAGIDPFTTTYAALSQKEIIILFPEGTRGEAEKLSRFKSGIAYLAQNCSNISVTPIFLHGLGKALPKGEMIFVPFFCDVFIGESLTWSGDKQSYMQNLDKAMQTLAIEGHFATWE